ncbi:hypothetical protein [Fontivita pretiosa]|uniref:hypothetical protein n=1 Tax=Fontivita pretiosa TaxID=2989684 RepID=UPI003D174635
MKWWRLTIGSNRWRALAVAALLLYAQLDASLLVRAFAADGQSPLLIHLPGIGGHMRIDDQMTGGLKLGGLDAEIRIYDWTNGNPGMPALGNYQGNQREAEKVAQMIVDARRASPSRRIILTGHSGGTGIAVWALEKLPDDVQIDTLLMIAPALSPQYDLTAALRHVRGNAYVFTSVADQILGWGTRSFGTIDRVKTDAAGRVGFTTPDTADPQQYAKLKQFAYDRAWTRYNNAGDHIGAMMRPFARSILAPLLLNGELPQSPATRPATTRSSGKA